MEIRPIPGFAPYEVSENGQVYRRETDGSLFAYKNQNDHGYHAVDLYLNRKRKRITVHRLVALAFIGPRPDGMDVCHNDGSRNNNHYSNLRYDTRKGNSDDKFVHGTVTSGEFSPHSILTGEQVEEIRNEIATNYRWGLQKALAQKYGVSEQTICCLKKRRSWKDGYRTRRVQADPEEAAAVSAIPRRVLQHAGLA